MTVAQLQKMVEEAKSQQRDDDFVVKKLAGVKVSNRLSASALSALTSGTGPRTTQALRYIADASAFLDPPANEIPKLPAPDVEAQKAMIRQSIHYVAHTLHALPNFTATRITQQLVDSPQGLERAQLDLLGGLYRVNTYRAPITLRDGKETEEPSVADGWKVAATGFNSSRSTIVNISSGPAIGLTAHGEFGPILASVILDVAKGKMNWARWEMSNGKPAAVFQFSVEKAASHFSVDFNQAAHVEIVDTNAPAPSGPQFAGRTYNTGQTRAMEALKATSDRTVNKQLAYHGELVLDPETGTILRIMILAAKLPDDPSKQAGMVAEYGPVQVGDETYICPTHSVALSTTAEHNGMITTIAQTMTETHLNVADFVGYHRFGSESTLVMNAAPSETQPDGPSNAASAKAGAATGLSASASSPADSELAGLPAPTSAVGSAAPAAGETVPAAKTPEPPAMTAAAETASSVPKPVPGSDIGSVSDSVTASAADEEILVHTADGIPGVAPADTANPGGTQASAGNANFTLKVASRLVNLDLVATSKRGKPLTDLRQDEIEIYDNGRKQTLVALGAAGTHPAATKPSASPATFTNTTLAADATPAPDLLILLMDETQLSNPDLSRARADVLRFLKSTPSSTRLAIYSTGAHGIGVIQEPTLDHGQVMGSVSAWAPNSSVAAPAQGFQPRKGRQTAQIDTPPIADVSAAGGAEPNPSADSAAGIDPQLSQLGPSPLRAPLTSILELARRLSPIPGRKSLVWISGDQALMSVDVQGGVAEKGTGRLLGAIAHAHDVLNRANVALYAVDGAASQGSNENVARDNHQDMATSDASGSGATNAHIAQHQGGGEAKSVATQERRGLLEPLKQLTESTGGHAFADGDLKTILENVERDASEAYHLSFHPDAPDDGKFHSLEVRVLHRNDVRLRYRDSYLSNDLADTNQQRFQQAVWTPNDANAIALTAEAIPAASPSSSTPSSAAEPVSGSGTIQLHIALSNLALEQTAGRWTGQFYVYVAQRDDAALKTNVYGDTVHLSLKQATYDSAQANGIPYTCRIDPKADLSSIRIIVIDGKSGQMGSVTLPSMALRPKG